MKKFIILISALLLLTLTGCSGINNYLESQMEIQSGVKDNSDYQTYQAYTESGSLDQEGYYLENVFEEESSELGIASDSARVTFSDNANLVVKYYSDVDLQNAITTNAYNIQTGDCIYASTSLNKSVSSSNYAFDGFRLYEIDEDGYFNQLSTITLNEAGLVLQFSEQLKGKELAIVPVGAYTTREITLRDSYVDNDEQEHDLSGTWIVNDKPVLGHVAEVNPVSSYIISYEFDGDEYFYLSSEPECYYINNEDGVIIFNKRESTDDTVDYKVKLHQYLTIDLTSGQHRYVNVNNGSEQEIKAGNALTISRLKYGDTVVIVTDVEWPELDTCRDLILQSSEELRQSGQVAYKYTLVVPQKSGEFAFDPSEYTYDHGTISFMCFGEEVTSIQYLAKGSRITYEQRTADDGYWLAEGDHVITVTTPEKTRKELENISFREKVRVTVQLKQPEYGGRIEYYANGSRIYSSEYKSYSGTEITMKFFPWEGWINNYKNGDSYIVTADLSQIVKIGGKDVSTSAFNESDDHKPTLEVVLAKSVGANMNFEFEASGLSRSDYSYEEAWYRNDYTIISKQPIGTECGITISMGNRAIQSGTAIKILVEMTGEDKSGNRTQKANVSYCRLVDSLTDLQEPIDIYDDAAMGNSSVWYKTIKITISVVDVMKFVAPTPIANGVVTVRNYETSEVLKNGDILEGSEKVTITIEANNGYYVSGKNVKNGVYQTTIKIEKCLEDLLEMISNHSIEKYIKITLDSKDSYGSCVYKYDGNVVTGTINMKLGDKLTIEYTITESGYVIDGASGLLGTSIGKKDTEAKETLAIDRTYDGKTLSRESFGISVKKGG